MSNKSPVELLNDALDSLSQLVDNAALFGRGSELDIKKAFDLLVLVSEAHKLNIDMSESLETPLGEALDGGNEYDYDADFNEYQDDGYFDQYDDDPNPYHGDYSEE